MANIKAVVTFESAPYIDPADGNVKAPAVLRSQAAPGFLEFRAVLSIGPAIGAPPSGDDWVTIALDWALTNAAAELALALSTGDLIAFQHGVTFETIAVP